MTYDELIEIAAKLADAGVITLSHDIGVVVGGGERVRGVTGWGLENGMLVLRAEPNRAKGKRDEG